MRLREGLTALFLAPGLLLLLAIPTNATATSSTPIGSGGAMKIASNHEAIRGGPTKEKKMDLANNKTGRSVETKKETVKKSQAQCQSLATNGKLKTLK